MGLFNVRREQRKPAPAPMSSNARTTKQWQRWEARQGCISCGEKGCHRMNHSHPICLACGSAYCDGEACPSRRR